MTALAALPEQETGKAFVERWRRDVVAMWVNKHGFVQIELRDLGAWREFPDWFRRRLILMVQARFGQDCLWNIRGPGPSNALIEGSGAGPRE